MPQNKTAFLSSIFDDSEIIFPKTLFQFNSGTANNYFLEKFNMKDNT